MSCNLNPVLKGKSNCKPNLAGVGDRIYVFDIDACFGENIPEPEDGLYVSNEMLNGKGDGTGIQGHCYPIDIKSDSGQVTSEKAEGQEGRSLVGTAVVDHSIDEFTKVDEVMAFKNIGVLIPDNNGKFYVIMSKYKRTKYTSNFDSGTTYDSDHGFTITFTCAPVLCGCPKVALVPSQLGAVQEWNGNYTFKVAYTSPSNGSLKVYVDGVLMTSATPSGNNAKNGSVVTVIAIPDEGHTFASLTIDGQKIVDPDYSYRVTKDSSITATFA